MVLNRRIADSSLLARPRFKIKQPLMPESGTSSSDTVTSSAAASISNIGKTSSMTITSGGVSLSQPTTHQKVRRILDEHAIRHEAGGKNHQQRIGRTRGNSLSSNIPLLVNYNIVASRGELSRASFSVRETGVSLIASRRARNDPNDFDVFFANGKDDSSRLELSTSNWEKCARDYDRSRNNCRINARGGESLPKSSSVPSNLKSVSGHSSTSYNGYVGKGNSGEGILRKSSAFLASLTHPKNYSQDRSKEDKPFSFSLLTRNVTPFIGGRSRANEHIVRRSPSCQNLSNTGKKKSYSRVKKSVSFSSDTSFKEKKSPFKKTAVHEAKVYRKGVLRDVIGSENNPTKKVPSGAWEAPSGDPNALLRASREADDLILRDLVTRIRRFGLGQMDVNAVDSSGRTAISYMAGNGSPAMLEAALSFANIDANLPDNEGNTPLHFAAQAGQTECLNIILEKCADIQVDARNVLGFTPLMKAALQGRTKCAKILLFAGANPTMKDHGRGLRAEQWARYCGRYVCADVIERFARHKMLEKNISCRWGSEPELATKVLQGKVIPSHTPATTGFRSKIKRVFRMTSDPDRSFSLVSQLTNAALCASTPALPKPGEVSPMVKSLIRPLSVPQLRVTLAGSQDIIERNSEYKSASNFTEKIENTITKPPRSKKKSSK